MSRRLKILVVHPGARTSISDVCDGLMYGLQSQPVDVVFFALASRIELAHTWLHDAWRRKRRSLKIAGSKERVPKPTVADVRYQAGMGALERALRHKVDAVLVVSGMYLHPDVVIMMRQAGLLVTTLMTESPYDEEHELKLAALCHAGWTHERASVETFRSVCPNFGYLPHAWHPLRHKPGPQPGDENVAAHDVVFVGTAFEERIAFFKAIDWTGIDLGLYGNWECLAEDDPLRAHVKGADTTNAVTSALYRRAKVGLNLYRTSKGYGPGAPRISATAAHSLSPRAYELAACGVFHLSEARAEVWETFGDAVPTFQRPTEAAALIRRWLADDAGRAAVAASLPAMVAESSWVHRASQVMVDLTALVTTMQRVA